jgi:hypothetical protein
MALEMRTAASSKAMFEEVIEGVISRNAECHCLNEEPTFVNDPIFNKTFYVQRDICLRNRACAGVRTSLFLGGRSFLQLEKGTSITNRI